MKVIYESKDENIKPYNRLNIGDVFRFMNHIGPSGSIWDTNSFYIKTDSNKIFRLEDNTALFNMLDCQSTILCKVYNCELIIKDK